MLFKVCQIVKFWHHIIWQETAEGEPTTKDTTVLFYKLTSVCNAETHLKVNAVENI